MDNERLEADQFFLGLGSRDQGALLRSMRDVERRLWIRLLAPDHAADVVQTFDGTERDGLLLLSWMNPPAVKWLRCSPMRKTTPVD